MPTFGTRRLNFRLGNLHVHVQGEQLAAGWPCWLSNVAQEALRVGRPPRRTDTFAKVDKIGRGACINVCKARDLMTAKVLVLEKLSETGRIGDFQDVL